MAPSSEFMDRTMELQKQNYFDAFLSCAFSIYNENKFSGNVTEREKQDITRLLSVLVSVPSELNGEFCNFIFQRIELPAVVSSILFASINHIKKFDIKKNT